MKALSESLYNVLKNDPALVALLGTYGDGPSIFTRRPVPVDAGRPVLVSANTVSDEPADLIGASVGRMIRRDVAVYGNATGDANDQSIRIDDAAERVKELLHHNRFAVSGWSNLMTLASGPVDAAADPQEEARVVTVTIRLQRFAPPP